MEKITRTVGRYTVEVESYRNRITTDIWWDHGEAVFAPWTVEALEGWFDITGLDLFTRRGQITGCLYGPVLTISGIRQGRTAEALSQVVKIATAPGAVLLRRSIDLLVPLPSSTVLRAPRLLKALEHHRPERWLREPRRMQDPTVLAAALDSLAEELAAKELAPAALFA